MHFIISLLLRLEAIHSNKNLHGCLHDDSDEDAEAVTPRDVTGARAVVCGGTEGWHQLPPPPAGVSLSLGRW